MKIIKDELCQINTHPLVIYFVMYSKDTKEREESLKQLNEHQIFTRGIFEFQTVEHIGKHSEVVSSEITKVIKRYNMFVRLADDGLDGFQYAVHKVNFNLSPSEVECSIQKFIEEVCKQNKKLLTSKIEQNSLQGNVSHEKQDALLRMKNVFLEALKLKNFEPGIWMKDSIVETPKTKTTSSRIDNSHAMPQLFVENFNKASLMNDPQFLWDWLESYTGAPDKESSDEIAQGYFNAQYDESLKHDIIRRRLPEDKPHISIEIKQITTRTRQDGNKKKKYAFIFHVDGQDFSITFGDKTQTLIYACTLLRRSREEKMFLHEFYNNGKGKKCKFQRARSKGWFEKVYKAFFSNSARDFADWYEKIKGTTISQGKSHANKQVGKVLKSQQNTYYYCTISTSQDEFVDSFYDIKISPENIVIPNELLFLLDDLK